MKVALLVATLGILGALAGCSRSSPPPMPATVSPIDYQRFVVNTNGLGHFVRWRFTLDGAGEAGIEIDDSKNQRHVRDVRILTPELIAAVQEAVRDLCIPRLGGVDESVASEAIPAVVVTLLHEDGVYSRTWPVSRAPEFGDLERALTERSGLGTHL